MSLEKEIKDVISCMIDSFEQEKEVKYGELASKLLNSKNNEYWWETPENFWIGFIYPAKQALEVILKKKYPNCSDAALKHIFTIYANYSAIERHIQWFLEPFEGSGGIADKSRRLINGHLNWLVKGSEDAIDPLQDRKDPTKRSWDCPQKGTPEQWHEYMLGLTFFFGFGDTVQIMRPYMELTDLYLEDRLVPKSKKK